MNTYLRLLWQSNFFASSAKSYSSPYWLVYRGCDDFYDSEESFNQYHPDDEEDVGDFVVADGGGGGSGGDSVVSRR